MKKYLKELSPTNRLDAQKLAREPLCAEDMLSFTQDLLANLKELHAQKCIFIFF